MRWKDEVRKASFPEERHLRWLYAVLMFFLLSGDVVRIAFYQRAAYAPVPIIFLRLVTVLLGMTLSKGRKNASFGSLAVLTLLMLLRSVLETFPSFSRDLLESWLYLVWTVGACYPLGLVLEKKQLRKLFLSIGAVWSAGMAFLACVGIHAAWMRVKFQNLHGSGMIGLWGEAAHARLQLVFLSTISGQLMAVSILIALICAVASRHKAAKLLFSLSILPMLVALSLTDSRTAQISVSAGMALFMLLLIRDRWPGSVRKRSPAPGRPPVFSLLCFSCCFLLLFLLLLLALRQINPLFDALKKASAGWPVLQSAGTQVQMDQRDYLDGTVMTGRFEIWHAVLSWLLRHPLYLLIGKSMILPMHEINEAGLLSFEASHCHNILLQVLLENGLPGFFLLLSVLLQTVLQAGRLIAARKQPLWLRLLPSLLAVICLGECAECLTWCRCHYLPFLPLLGFTSGLIAAGGRQKGDVLSLRGIRADAAKLRIKLLAFPAALPALFRRLKPLAALLVFCGFLFFTRSNLSLYPVIHQDDYARPDTDLYYDCGDPLCETNAGRHTISTSGCGACAIVNAVCYLTGTQPDVREVAAFVREKNEYIVHEGSKATLYQDYAEAFGPRYGFRFVRQADHLEEATEYLRQGCVVLAGAGNSHGGGHLLVLADYSPADGKYLILDSAGNSANWSRAFASWQVIRDNRPEKNPDVLLTSFRVYAAAGACYRGF